MAITVDTRGKLCPLPLILFRKAVKDHPDEKTFDILTDNQISCGNLMDYIRQNAYRYTREDSADGVTTLHVTIPTVSTQTVSSTASDTPPRSLTGKRVVQIRSDIMGQGDNQLGTILILAYLNALKELDRLPTHIICYNSGVKLATKCHEASATLLELHSMGVEVIVCGTCTNYFGITDDLAVGKISNMFTIAELLHAADTIVMP